MAQLEILLIDDHPLIVSGIAGLLGAAGHFVRAVRNLADARTALAELSPAIVLLDINLGSENGLDLLDRDALPTSTRVIMVSGISEQELIFHGFERGAFGFVPKSVEPDSLLAAIADMAARDAQDANGWVWDAQQRQCVPAHEFFPRATILTPKEREVFMLLREGLLDKQIADRLGLSIHTVRVHLRAIKRKRGHNRRSEQQAQE